MKLAIVVVYMVSEEHQKLLDIHLDRIRRHTSVPYTIHGSVNRLLPACRAKLESFDDVRVYDPPPTDLRGAEEHSYYLDHLIRGALEDGATHIVALHTDSFPIRDGWIETLAATLSDSCAFATVERINTACLLFPREFHRALQPPFLLSETLTRTALCTDYIRETAPSNHSGIGYGFSAYQAGLTWYSMRPSAATAHYPDGPVIYDDMLFHLSGAIRLSKHIPGAAPSGVLSPAANRRFARLLAKIRSAAPESARRIVRATFKRSGRWWLDEPALRWLGSEMASDAERLLADPDGYIEQMRSRNAID